MYTLEDFEKLEPSEKYNWFKSGTEYQRFIYLLDNKYVIIENSIFPPLLQNALKKIAKLLYDEPSTYYILDYIIHINEYNKNIVDKYNGILLDSSIFYLEEDNVGLLKFNNIEYLLLFLNNGITSII